MDKTFLTSLAAVFLALASSMAHGQVIDLDATGTMPVGTVTLSNETFLNTNTVTAGRQVYYTLAAATSTDLQVNGTVGIRGTTGRQIYIRHDLTNMVFATAASDTGSTTTGTVRIPDANNDGTPGPALVMTRESGGAAGSASVIYSAADGAVIDADAVVSAFFADGELAILPNTRGDIAMSVFLELSDALSGGSSVASKEKTAATTANSVSTSVTPGAPVTASVASSFTQLTSLGRVAPNSPQPLGSVNIRVGPTRGIHTDARDGTAVSTLEDVMRPANSEMKFSGDFSVGRFSLSADGCATSLAGALRMNAANDEATVAPTSWDTGARSLCIMVPNTNTTPIAAGAFMVEADYAPLANAAFGPTDLALAQIGRIRRDGTTVQIPYLTTATEYNQRISIVNRLGRSASYNFVITAMDDATVALGDMASGTIPANTTMVVMARDVVTITGGTEASATLNVVATSGQVDVFTTQINSRGETDSVVYESMPN